MDGMVLLPKRNEDDFAPTPGGLLDGLPKADHGSSYEWLMGSEDPGNEQEADRSGMPQAQDSVPKSSEAADNSPQSVDDKLSDVGSEDHGSIAGKIWNLPNTVVGLGVGGLGYLAGWPSKWIVLQTDAPGITTGDNAVQFTNNPFGGVGAVTLGNVEVINGQPTDRIKGTPIGQHEEQHTYQGEQLGPFYLPSNIFGGLAGELIDGNWHGPHNWNEVGPQQPTPVPWPR